MELAPLDYKSVQTGLITEGALSEHRMPLDAVTESLNFHFDKIGAATLRKGTTRLGDALSGNILGLYEFRDSGSGTNNQILLANSTTVKYLNGSSVWTNKRTGLTAGKTRFTTFLDYVWMVNGTDATAIWDGNTGNNFLTNGNASGAPVGKFIDNFRSRVWITGNSTFPDRIYFSSLPSAEATPVVTWNTDVTTGDWIDISPSDGENITGLKRAKNTLLIFKNNHIYRVYSVQQTDPDPAINVGTYSNESIVETKDGIYFHHPTGFYRYGYDGGVSEISKPITDIARNISLSNYSNVAGWIETSGDAVCWALGNVTINGVTYNNLEVRYTISTQTWTHYSKPSQILCASRYNDGSTVYQLVGDNSGNVLKINTGTDDNGTAISYSLIHRWYTVDGQMSTRKNIEKLLFHHEGERGSNVQYQIEDDPVSDWTKPLGQLDKSCTLLKCSIKGRKFRPRISGSSTGEPFTYSGFEIIKASSELINV